MAMITNPLVSLSDLRLSSSPGYSLRSSKNNFLNGSPLNLSFSSIRSRKGEIATLKRQIAIKSGCREAKFILGGFVLGTLGYICASEIRKGLARAAVIRALEERQKILIEDCERLKSIIDYISSQHQTDDEHNGVAVASNEIESAV